MQGNASTELLKLFCRGGLAHLYGQSHGQTVFRSCHGCYDAYLWYAPSHEFLLTTA